MRDSEEKGNDKGNEWRKQAIKINLGGRGWNGSSRMKKKESTFLKKIRRQRLHFKGPESDAARDEPEKLIG